MTYVYFFIKCVVRWSENSVRFENLMGIGFQMGQFCEILSQCEIWHVRLSSASHSEELAEGRIGNFNVSVQICELITYFEMKDK